MLHEQRITPRHAAGRAHRRIRPARRVLPEPFHAAMTTAPRRRRLRLVQAGAALADKVAALGGELEIRSGMALPSAPHSPREEPLQIAYLFIGKLGQVALPDVAEQRDLELAQIVSTFPRLRGSAPQNSLSFAPGGHSPPELPRRDYHGQCARLRALQIICAMKRPCHLARALVTSIAPADLRCRAAPVARACCARRRRARISSADAIFCAMFVLSKGPRKPALSSAKGMLASRPSRRVASRRSSGRGPPGLPNSGRHDRLGSWKVSKSIKVSECGATL